MYRLVTVVGASTAYVRFTYDWYATSLRLVPRVFALLDYTQGSATGGVGAADLVHGESGDDVIHGMTGDDVLFGEGQDDDLYGGTGNDRIYAGTGVDGVLGDDGKLLTSRNGFTETLIRAHRREHRRQPWRSTDRSPGRTSRSTASCKKEARLVPAVGVAVASANDVIYGGLGDDFLHGGPGDDAISGAEALREFYNEGPVDTNPLDYNASTTKFAAYDADDPWAKIDGWLLNFDAYVVDEATGAVRFAGGLPVKSDDGSDRLFGDDGNDWLVGGTELRLAVRWLRRRPAQPRRLPRHRRRAPTR